MVDSGFDSGTMSLARCILSIRLLVPQPLPFPGESMSERIARLLSQLSLEEKATLTGGDDLWSIPGLPHQGIPAMRVTDGPNGARGLAGSSACFPCGTALAATWNTDLIRRVGTELGLETQGKGASVLLAPTVNIHRSPLNGRNFECFSEDPYLAGQMAVAYIQGLQSQGVAACVKHYVCNDSEYQRAAIDVVVDERTLREIYLAPFEMAIGEGGSWAIMSAYNRVNGVYASESVDLLKRILKEEWGFDGLVMTDWFAAKSTTRCYVGGLDLEMPGPALMFGSQLASRIQAGELSEAELNDKVRRYLRLAERTGVLDGDGPQEKPYPDRPAARALIRQAARESFVLLKNEGDILPLDQGALSSLAVLGPAARTGAIMGGGSAFVNPPYVVHPMDALQQTVPEDTEIHYERGCHNHLQAPLLEPEAMGARAGEARVQVEYFNNRTFAGDPVAQEMRVSSEIFWFGALPEGVEPNFAARVTIPFRATASGEHRFGLTNAGLARLQLDSAPVLNNWEEFVPGSSYFGMGSVEKIHSTILEAGQPHELTLEFAVTAGRPFGAVRLGVAPPLADNAVEQAAQAARKAQTALVFVGLNADWESEGHDRPHMDLPGRQNELVSAVAAQNPRTVVIVNAGAPVTMPWIDEVAAVLHVWYPGQEYGNAITALLWGEDSPAGRLPITFPKRLEDTPAFTNYPGQGGQVRYGEGVFVGYRHYDFKDVEPLFPFGHGLSYTSFVYSNLQIEPVEDGVPNGFQITLDVQNVGSRKGDEVVQLYVGPQIPSNAHPPRELKGFRRVPLEPGAQSRVEFRISPRDLAFFDVQTKGWKAAAGTYQVHLGASSRDIRLTGEIPLEADWPARPDAAADLTLDTPMPLIMAHKREALFAGLGEAAQVPQMMMLIPFAIEEGLSLNGLSDLAPELLTADRLACISTLLQD